MAIQRHWLDWDKACLPQAAAWLIDRHRSAGSTPEICDLQQVACVLSGARAGRMMLGYLIRECQARQLQLIPPTVHTPGSLASSLVTDQPIASDVEMELAWAAALRQADRASLAPLLPFEPDDDDVLAWQSLAKTIAGLHADLSGGCKRFSDVADLAERLELFGEGDRWRALVKVRELYRHQLHSLGLRDRHELIEEVVSHEPAEQFACMQMRQIVLIAVPEMNAVQRRLIAAAGERAVALIHASGDLANRFDDLGCVIADQWQDACVAVDRAQILVADRPADQAQQTLHVIAGFNGRYSAGEITIGLGDPALAPAIEHAAQWADLSVRDAAGIPLRQTPPCRALEAIGAYVSDARFATFAALLRHPDIERWVFRRTRASESAIDDWLTLLDKYFQAYFDGRQTDQWLGDAHTVRRMNALHHAVGTLLGDLRSSPAPRRQTMPDWAESLLNLLGNLYSESDANPHAPANALRISACCAIRDALSQLCAAPVRLQPPTSASDAIAWLLDHLEAVTLPQRVEGDAIEMLGWLEMHLDPAPALVITGVNEGNIPSSTTSDPFLPDSLREKLGLSCNATRFARDAYLLEAILHSRPQVTLIAGRRSERGETLTPSRLLLACDETELVDRVKLLCDEKSPAAPRTPIGVIGQAASLSQFVVPRLPQPLPAVEFMRITDFRAYLACPYRFALSRLLRLESFDDSAIELDPLQFGNLAHEVLCAFGADNDINTCEDSAQIEGFLISELRRRVPTRFGSAPGAAVRIQIARMEVRLAAFAHLQAQLCHDGWCIKHCELPFSHSGQKNLRTAGPASSAPEQNIALDIPDQAPMPLHGKIDRIDFNRQTGAWRIIDYKTSESADSPHKIHTGREQCDGITPDDWKDLQLPLYHYLATRSTHDIKGDIQLAYICLPKQSSGTSLKAAKWTSEHLAQALDVARSIVRRIRGGEFNLNRDFSGVDDFARICQTDAYLEEESQEVEA